MLLLFLITILKVKLVIIPLHHAITSRDFAVLCGHETGQVRQPYSTPTVTFTSMVAHLDMLGTSFMVLRGCRPYHIYQLH